MAGQMDEAIKLYQQSIEIFPTAEAHTFLGWAYSFKGRLEDAIAECQKAIEVDPDFGNPYNDIGAYLIELGQYDEALPWLEQATQAKRYDAYFYAHYNMGRVWEQKGNWMRALSCYQEAYRLNPDYTLAERAMIRVRAKLN
ncbi:MAG TPA: hypothetical protein DIS66_07550 [Candidatus Omnitrophica bacterium]|nr:hypothetical protein [Candidatus Omnitrophota bacterium]